MTQTPASTFACLFLAIGTLARSNYVSVIQIAENVDSVSQQNSQSRRKPLFEKVAGADVTDNDDGTRFSMNSYRARDGVMVTELHGRFETTAGAEYYFDKHLLKAVSVEHRGIKMNRKGTAIGKRAQIISQVVSQVDPPESRDVPAILWTTGIDFYELTSDSLPHILSLEKELTP
jgi:hypothetical protein